MRLIDPRLQRSLTPGVFLYFFKATAPLVVDGQALQGFQGLARNSSCWSSRYSSKTTLFDTKSPDNRLPRYSSAAGRTIGHKFHNWRLRGVDGVDGSINGRVSQTFSTVAGQTCTLEYDVIRIGPGAGTPRVWATLWDTPPTSLSTDIDSLLSRATRKVYRFITHSLLSHRGQ
jgi:hypothetical protein